jgi:hypothetical protein
MLCDRHAATHAKCSREQQLLTNQSARKISTLHASNMNNHEEFYEL